MAKNRIAEFFNRADFTTADFATGGKMPDDHLDAFVQIMRDRSQALKACRVEVMRSATKVLDTIDLPGFSLYSPDECEVAATGDKQQPIFARRTMTALKCSMAMDWSTETIEDSIEEGDIETTLLTMLAKNYANQTTQLAIRGDVAAVDADPVKQAFYRLNEGWLKIAKTLAIAGSAQRHDTTGSVDYKAILSAMIGKIPDKYKDSGLAEDGWEIWCDPATEQAFRDQLSARMTALGDEMAAKGRRAEWQGLPVIPRGYFPAKTILLTPPKNLVYGLRREPKVKLWYDNDADKVKARVHGRLDFEVVVPDLIVIGYDV